MAMVNKLEEEIVKKGGKIHKKTGTEKIVIRNNRTVGILAEGQEVKSDLVVCTLAPSLLFKLLPDAPQDFKKNYSQIDYLGALCLVLQLQESLTPIYWLNISDSTVPMTSIVEHTNLIDRKYYQGNVYMYLGNYLSQKHRYFSMSADQLLVEYEPHLKRIFPKYERFLVKEKWLFKDLFAQPVMEIGYSKKIPPLVTSIPNLYHISMAQVYPEDRGTNFSIKLAITLVEEIIRKVI